ncbi:pectin methylesterase [Treponema parvum]|uniref:Pectinesterase n=1 Tax=Treponema parvum TaxID=138851 RepID=A0A975IBF5_9SPIR|nr:pectinesterase family protein [Treponema parvum]QTQ10966.1 pectin methylesterase [Treponema parvum]
MSRIYTVAADGSGDFTAIQDALNTEDGDVVIKLKPGLYKGQIFSAKKRLKILGEDPEKTVISGNIGAKDIHPDGYKTGTFRSFTAYFAGDSVFLENLTIENTAGQGTDVGQAVALYASASYVYCKNLKILGHQDTLFTAPLPEKERIPGGFKGPEENSVRKPSLQCYEDCFISGTVDFIFGSADVLFKNCTVCVRDSSTECYITAPSSFKDGTGYIFDGCTIVTESEDGRAVRDNPNKNSGDSSMQRKNVYLGRPWREFAKCCWMNCDLSDVICDEAWDNWRNAENEKTCRFSVYKNKWNRNGEGGLGGFAHSLSGEEAYEMTRKAKDIQLKVIAACRLP